MGLCIEDACILEGAALVAAAAEAAPAIEEEASALAEDASAVSEEVSAVESEVSSGLKNVADRVYNSFRAFKRAEGSAGEGNEWHHVVEQNPTNVAKFGQQAVQRTSNLVRVSQEVHRKISGYFSSKISDLSGNQTVRQWMSAKSYEVQKDFGEKILKYFGGGQ